MNVNSSILTDYENIYNAIHRDIVNNKKIICNTSNTSAESPCNIDNLNCSNLYDLNKKTFECYLTPEDAVETSKQTIYLKNIYEKTLKLSTILNFDQEVSNEDKNENEKSVIEILRDGINKKKKLIKSFKFIFGAILIMAILFYCFLILENTKEGKRNNIRSLYCNNLNIIIFLSYLIIVVNNNSNSLTTKLDAEEKTLNDMGEDDLNKLNTTLKSLKTKLEIVLCDSDPNILSSKLSGQPGIVNVGDISEYLNNFNENYKAAEKKINKNLLLKEQKIDEINELFTDFKHIIYKQENKFKDVIVDNSSEIHCLMNLIINKDDCNNEVGVIKCSLNNKCGIKGLIEVNSKSSFRNNLDIIDDNEIDTFFNFIKKGTFNKNSKYQLNNLNIFKVIKNIFIMKIYHNQIEKKEFIKYIYNHFDKVDLRKHQIEINKFDIILNYKELINIIYSDYEIYKKTENKSNPTNLGNIVSKSRFTNVIRYYNTDQLDSFELKLNTTIDKIDAFKQTFKYEIYDDLNSRRNTNNHIKYLSYAIIAISVIDFFCYFMEENNKSQGITEPIVILEIIRRISIIVLINMIIFSYWYKIDSYLDMQELIIQNNNNIFSQNLKNLQEKLNNTKNIKKIKNYQKNKEELNKLLNIYSIKATINNNKTIFSKYNDGNNYTILDENDIENIVVEDFYNNLIEVMRLYECCSFLNKKPKVSLFPWTEFTINIIFIAIVGLVTSQLLVKFNPMDLIEKFNPTDLIDKMKGAGGRVRVNTQQSLGSKVNPSQSPAQQQSSAQPLGSKVNPSQSPAQQPQPQQQQQQQPQSPAQLLGSKVNPSPSTAAETETKQEEQLNAKYMLNFVIISLSLYYSYQIYWSTIEYQQNLYRT